MKYDGKLEMLLLLPLRNIFKCLIFAQIWSHNDSKSWMTINQIIANSYEFGPPPPISLSLSLSLCKRHINQPYRTFYIPSKYDDAINNNDNIIWPLHIQFINEQQKLLKPYRLIEIFDVWHFWVSCKTISFRMHRWSIGLEYFILCARNNNIYSIYF